MKQIVIFLLSAVLLCAAANAAEHYVATDGKASNPGTKARPWPTIGHALKKVKAGDTVIVKDGLYNGRISTSRSFSDWVTIKAENPYHVKLTNMRNGRGSDVLCVYTNNHSSP